MAYLPQAAQVLTGQQKDAFLLAIYSGLPQSEYTYQVDPLDPVAYQIFCCQIIKNV
jgi:hypothetical protein